MGASVQEGTAQYDDEFELFDTFGVFEEDGDSLDDGIAQSVTTSVEDSDYDYLAEEAEESDEDKVTNELMQALDSAGYAYDMLENKSLEELNLLREHDVYLRSCDSDKIQESVLLVYENTLNELINSIAIQEEDSSVDITKYISYTDSPAEIDGTLFKASYNIVRAALFSDNGDVTTNYVLNELLKGMYITKTDLEENQDVYLDYFSYFIEQMKKFMSDTRKRLEDTAIKKQDTAQYLMRNEYNNVKKLRGRDAAGIKYIDASTDAFCCYCPKCRERVELPDIGGSYVIFAINSTGDVIESYNLSKRTCFTMFIPSVAVCDSCDTALVFSPYDIASLTKNLYSVFNKAATNFVAEGNNTAKSVYFTRTEVPHSMLMRFISYMYSGQSEIAERIVSRSPAPDLEDEIKTITVDYVEIKNAAEAFYKNLKVLQPAKMTGINQSLNTNNKEQQIFGIREMVRGSVVNRLTYREIAITISESLGKNYDQVKKQAIFSLLSIFHETEVINAITGCREIAALECFCEYVDSLPDNAELLKPEDTISVLIEFSKRFNDKCDSLQEKLDRLKSEKRSCFRHHAKLIENREIFFRKISEHVEFLASTNIINLNQYSAENFYYCVSDSCIAALLDNITDRMIINNYAEEFFSVYVKKNIFNPVSVKGFNKKVEAAGVFESLGNMFEKVSDKYTSSMGLNPVVDHGFVDEVFSGMMAMSNNELKPLKMVYDAFRSNDYYEFIKSLSSLRGLVLKGVSRDLIKLLEEVSEQAYKEFSKITCDKLVFYLRDFTIDEINEAKFRIASKLNNLSFGLRIPKRINDESLEDWIERFQNIKYLNDWSDVEYYDYKVRFEEYSEFFAEIVMCNGVSSLTFGSFTKSKFISGLSDIATQAVDRDFGMYLFGLKDYSLIKFLDGKESISVRNNLSTEYKILNGYYSTFVEDEVIDFTDLLHSKLITSKSNFEHWFADFDVISFVKGLISSSDESLLERQKGYMDDKKKSTEGGLDLEVESVAEYDAEDLKNTIIVEFNRYSGRNMEDFNYGN